MIGDAVALYHLDKMLRCVTGKCRFAEMRIIRKIIGRRRTGIGEIAAAAAGHQYFLAAAIGMFDQQDRFVALSRSDGAHQAGSTATNDDGIEYRSVSHWRGAGIAYGVFYRLVMLFRGFFRIVAVCSLEKHHEKVVGWLSYRHLFWC